MTHEVLDLLLASARRAFERWRRREMPFRPEDRGWQNGLWTLVNELGLPRCLAAEEHGGAALTTADALAIVRLAGEFALPLPLGESMLAHRLLSQAGLGGVDGALTIAAARPRDDALQARRRGDALFIEGVAHRVPWGRDVEGVVVLALASDGPVLALQAKGSYNVLAGANLASEPRDTLVFANAQAQAHAAAPATPDELLAWGAALRVAQMAGATSEALRLAVDYANTREQFGRTISKFQVIQQYLAVLASQSAICTGAADIAARALEGTNSAFSVACAKARAGEAATTATSIAHQVFGAIGFSREHDLHRTTQRLLSWRDEFGAEAFWSARLGEMALCAGGDGLWPLISA